MIWKSALRKLLGANGTSHARAPRPTRPAKPKRAVPRMGRAPRRQADAAAGSGADVFRFRENLSASGRGPRIAKHIPRPGSATVEVIDDTGKVLLLDSFRASDPAPAGPWFPMNGQASTFVIDGATDLRHQEFEFALDGPHPLRLPQHVRDKIHFGGRTARIWWSCET